MKAQFALAAILAALVLTPSVASALPGKKQQLTHHWRRPQRPHPGQQVPPQHVGAPELDPNAAGQALALLLGSSLVLIDRRRRFTAA